MNAHVTLEYVSELKSGAPHRRVFKKSMLKGDADEIKTYISTMEPDVKQSPGRRSYPQKTRMSCLDVQVLQKIHIYRADARNSKLIFTFLIKCNQKGEHDLDVTSESGKV